MDAVKDQKSSKSARVLGMSRRNLRGKSVGFSGKSSGAGASMHTYKLGKERAVKIVGKAISENKALILMPDGNSVKVLSSEVLIEGMGRVEGIRRVLKQFIDALSEQKPVGTKAVSRDAAELSAEAQARLIGREIAAADLKAAGGGYTLDNIVELLGITRQAIANRRKAGMLLAVPVGGARKLVYPAFQFDADGDIVSGLDEVSDVLGYSSPWSVLNFFVERHDDFDGKTSMDLLKAGEKDLVLHLARQHAALDPEPHERIANDAESPR